MAKKHPEGLNIFQITLKGLILYFKNIIPLSRVMMFPVFGQLAGVFLILFPAFLISKNMAHSIDNLLVLFMILLISIIPGFFIFLKAFWEYMIAMVSLNTMIQAAIKHGNIKDIKVHYKNTKNRSKEYVNLLLILSGIWLAGLLIPASVFLIKNPFDIKPLGVATGFIGLEILALIVLSIASIYLSLCFQVFAFENLSASDSLKKSWKLVEGNFWKTFIIGIISFIITGTLFPELIKFLVHQTAFVPVLVTPFKAYSSVLLANPQNISIDFASITQNPQIGASFPKITVDSISEMALFSTLGLLLTSFLLPLSTAFYTLLYSDITTRKYSKKK